MRPDRRDTPTRRNPIPSLCFASLRPRLEAARNGTGSRQDNQEFARHSHVTLYRTTSATRWDVTATTYDADITLYLNHTLFAVVGTSLRNRYRREVRINVDPHNRVDQVRMWVNRVLKDNHTGYKIVTIRGKWYIHDTVYDPTKDTLLPFQGHFSAYVPDAKEVLTNV